MAIVLSIIRQMFMSNKERKTSFSSFIEICLGGEESLVEIPG